MVSSLDSKGAKECTPDRSRQGLSEQDPYSNEYWLQKIGFDTAENEPSEACQELDR